MPFLLSAAGAKGRNPRDATCGIPRSTSPSSTSSAASSIPTPGGRTPGNGRSQSVGGEKHVSRIATVKCVSDSTKTSTAPRSVSTPGVVGVGKQNNSMLDKFKFFNKDKAKCSSSKTATTTLPKGVGGSAGVPSTSRAAGKPDGKSTKDGRTTPLSVPRHAAAESAGTTPGVNSAKTVSKPAVKKSVGHSRKDLSGSRDDVVAAPRRSGTLVSSHATSSSNIATASSVKRHLASAKSNDRLDSNVGKTSTFVNGSPGTGKKTSKIASLSGKGSTTKLMSRSTTPTSLSGSLASPVGSGLPTKSGIRSSMRLPKDEASKVRSLATNKDVSRSAHGSTLQASHGASPRATPPPSDGQVQSQGHDVTHTNTVGKSTKTNSSQIVPPVRISSAKSSTGDVHGSSRTPSSYSSTRALPQKSQSKKVDSDTQTAMSAMRSLAKTPSPKQPSPQQPSPQQPSRIGSPTVTRLQSPHQVPSPSRSRSPCPAPSKERAPLAQRECSNSSVSSNGTVQSCGAESNVSSSTSASNSNNSASSTESVIFRPSSCDELDDDDSEVKIVPLTDHISSLRNSRRLAAAANQTKKPVNKKMETTFDVCVRTEVTDDVPAETAITEDVDTFDVDIKPMQPINRSTPYSYLRGLNSQLARPSFHIPLTQQNISLAQSASCRLGANQPLVDPSKLYLNSMRRTTSNMLDADYASDAGDSFDATAGYMSDGDILRSSGGDDYTCGYVSEGGATVYAKRMQQRFREGMMAVKECMQKSSGIIDNER